MPMEKVVFEHSKGDAVKIKVNGVKGKVLALHRPEYGDSQYLVRYVSKDDVIREIYFYAADIEDWKD